MQKRSHTLWAASVAAAAAVALAAGMTTVPAAAQDQAAATGADQTGTARHWITLITGDQVAVDAKGQPVSLRRAKGREHIPVQVHRLDGHVYAMPLDALRLVSQGKVDRRLFDLTTLGKPEYRERQRDGLRLIVTYRGKNPAARADLRAAGDTEVERTFPRLNADAVTAPAQDAVAVWDAVTNEPKGAALSRTAASGIASIWLDGIRKAALDESVPQIGAPQAWEAGYDGKGAKIAVLDTGVDQTHPDLAGQEIAEKNFSEAPDAKDRFGHGTHVASIAAGTGTKSGGKYKGVAPGARILDGKVLDDYGSGDDSGILAGMEWAAAQQADVVNMSLGGPDGPGEDPLEAAVNKLSADTGMLFVIAAGNEGPRPGTLGSPGTADAALTVGAVDKQDRLADFSSVGPRTGDSGLKPDVTAPGVDIAAAEAPGSVIAEVGDPVAPGYVSISGTSMATPHTAGSAAILAQQHPDWTGAEIKAALASSAVPGKGYGAFQQGTGRVELSKAIKQTVVAKNSVSFGKQSWPHTDDTPVTKEITYRNLGTEPVTVDLSVTGVGPDGKPAPEGFFSLAKQQLTLPAQGEGTVSLTADTRLGGTVDGAYSASVVATGGGQTVSAVAAVDREAEAYDLSVAHLGRDGKSAAAFETLLFGVGGQAAGEMFFLDNREAAGKLRLPKGDYVLSSIVPLGTEDNWQGGDLVTQPVLKLRKDTTVTVDARTAKPVDVTVPDSKARAEFATFDLDYTGAEASVGLGYWLDSFKGFRTAHLGPKASAGSLHSQVSAAFQRADGSKEYQLAWGSGDRTIPTGFTRHLKNSDLAKLSVKLGASVKNKHGYLGAMADTGSTIGGYVSFERKLPHTSTVYVNGKGATWSLYFEQVGEDFEAWYNTGTTTYQPGKSYEKSFNIGVFGPALHNRHGIFRKGNKITANLPVLADGKGHTGGSLYDKATTTLYRNGKKVGSNHDPLTGEESFTVPAGKADYKLSSTVSRSKVANVSTKIATNWTFSSGKVASRTKLPTSVVRFTPSLAADSTGKAGATVKVPVTVQGTAAGSNLKSLKVYVSYDNGAHWKKLTVRGGKVSVKNPAAGKTVSFKAIAVDKKGNTVNERIHQAYRTR